MTVQYDADLHDPIIKTAVWKLLPLLPYGLNIDDAMQVARIAVWKTLPSYDPTKGKVEAFVATIARRRVIDVIRSSNRSLAYDYRYGSGDSLVPNLSFERLVDEGYQFENCVVDDTDESVLRCDSSKLVQEALKYLSSNERCAVMLYASGFSQREVARKMHVTPPRISQLIGQARGRLLRILPKDAWL